jgi:streptomycin 6-kinase
MAPLVLDRLHHSPDTLPMMASGNALPRTQPPRLRLRDVRALDSTDFAPTQTPAGRKWIAGLASLVEALAEDWRLSRQTDAIWYGYNAVVMPVERDEEPLALKVAWPAEPVALEVRALAAWRGRGAVGLMASDERRGALLLRRLDPARSLAGVPLAEAASAAGRLIRTLAIAAPEGIPSMEAVALGIAASLPVRQRLLGTPIPGRWLDGAVGLANDLSAARRPALIHADLHYGNVLASGRRDAPWTAIDPKPFVGDPERSVAELLWTRADELADVEALTGLLEAIVGGGGLDRDRAIAWGFVRAIDYWLWGLEHRLTIDPVRCERVASALASPVLVQRW